MALIRSVIIFTCLAMSFGMGFSSKGGSDSGSDGDDGLKLFFLDSLLHPLLPMWLLFAFSE